MTIRPATMIAALVLAMLLYVGLVNVALFKICALIRVSSWHPEPAMRMYDNGRLWLFGWRVPLWLVLKAALVGLGFCGIGVTAIWIQQYLRRRNNRCLECGRRLAPSGRCEFCHRFYQPYRPRLGSRFEVLPPRPDRRKVQRCNSRVWPISSA